MMDRVGQWPFIALLLTATMIASSGWSADTNEESRRMEVGQVLPGFDLKSLDGERLNPESLRGEAPLVLIFFRGTW